MPQTDVCLYVTSLAGGGAHKMMVHIAKGLSGLGYCVDLVLVKKQGAFVDTVPEKVNIIDLDASRTIYSVPGLTRYLNKHNPRVMFVTPVAPTVPAIWASKLSSANTKVIPRIPVVLSECRFYKNPENFEEEVMPHLMKTFYPLADSFVAISQGVADDLASSYNIDSNNITKIYNPTIDDGFVEKSNRKIEHPYFDKPVPVLIGVGRLTKQKDFPTLIRSFDRLLSDRDAHLIILGEGEERDELEEIINKKGISSKVSMPGFVDNPYPYIRQSDVFVLSSAWEGFGNVIPEALACGTPVVSTNCKSGPQEILKNGEYGSLVEVGNVEQLYESIKITLEEETDEDKLKRRAQDFTIESIAPQYAALI